MEYNASVNGYTFIRKRKEGKDCVVITFFKNHEVFMVKEYEEMSREKENEVRKKLFEFTEQNLNSPMSRCIPFFTILKEIERIIFEE